MRCPKITIGVIVAFLLATTGNGRTGDCNFLPKEIQQGQGTRYLGQYKNEAYEYSIRIPDMLAGYDQSTPPHHGFGIAFGSPPESYISVYSQANSLEYKTPMDRAIQLLEYLREDGKEIESVSVTRSQLGTLGAVFFVTTYSCGGSAQKYVKASTIALSPSKGTLYEVTLYTVAERYNRDRIVFEQLVKSWKYEPR